MKRYRIKEYTFNNSGNKQYVVQKKSVFGFWYNSDNVDAYTTGWYGTLQEAKDIIAKKLFNVSSKIVYIKSNKESREIK